METLKLTLLTDSPSDDILTTNMSVFKSAKDSMKAPLPEKKSVDDFHMVDYPMDDFPFAGGSIGTNQDKPTEEQEIAGKNANDKINSMFEVKDELISYPTFDSDSTEVAKQYIGAIHSFEEAQDSFFEGFLSNQEPNNLEDYFKETLV